MISEYLKKHVESFSLKFIKSKNILIILPESGERNWEDNRLLYKCGVASPYFYMVVRGIVSVRMEHKMIKSEQGAYKCLGGKLCCIQTQSIYPNFLPILKRRRGFLEFPSRCP